MAIGLCTLLSCSQNTTITDSSNGLTAEEERSAMDQKPHSYGGWYCPDNLGGFPAVDINDWENVPVVNGRLPTKEEAQNGTSLIFVDLEKYPNAKPLDMQMPKLARYHNRSSRKDELIIVIQAVNVSNDSVVGFRYLNGGNGSARLNEVTFLSEKEIDDISPSRFVSIQMDIDASRENIWEVLTDTSYYVTFKAIFDKGNSIKLDMTNLPKVNFKYPKSGFITSDFAGDLYGNKYIQIDCKIDDYHYVEKFLVGENQQTKSSELVITCGPYGHDFETQKRILNRWAQKVKELSEGKK
jgi:hypothetical protein